MASSTTSSSLMLTHSTSTIINSQDYSSSHRSFPLRPLSRTFFLSPLVLKSSNLFHCSYQSRSSSHCFAASLAADVAETDEEENDSADDESSNATNTLVVSTKPKTGKAALLLKSDRVSSNSFPFYLLFFFKFHSFVAPILTTVIRVMVSRFISIIRVKLKCNSMCVCLV